MISIIHRILACWFSIEPPRLLLTESATHRDTSTASGASPAKVGSTDKMGGDVRDRRYTPADYAETIYRKLGIATDHRLLMADGTPLSFTDGGRPIEELF